MSSYSAGELNCENIHVQIDFNVKVRLMEFSKNINIK